MKERLTMLVVDDVEVNRALLRETFLETYDVVEAADGIEAMEVMHRQRIDIVILDLCMPRLNGVGVIKQMKAEEELCNIPVVVKTAIDENSEVQVLELGADDFVFSPCDPAIVRNRVNNIVQKYIYERTLMQRRIEEERRLSRVRGTFIQAISQQLYKSAQDLSGTVNHVCEAVAEEATTVEALGRLERQTEELLEFSELVADIEEVSSGDARSSSETFQLNEIVETIAEEFYGMCRKAGVGFHLEVHGMLREKLFGDCTRVHWIWNGLLLNAYQFTDGEGCVETSFSERVHDTGRAELSLKVKSKRSNAAGAKNNEFYVRKVDGLNGLRISMLQGIVALMGGSFLQEQYENELTYQVKLLFDIEKQTEKLQKNFKSMETIIIDDDEIAGNYLAAIFARLGIRCNVVPHVEQALMALKDSYASGNGYDLCYINWQMENGMGPKAVEQIRQKYGRDALLLISATSGETEASEEMKEQGIDYVLRKPVLQADVYKLMTEIYKTFTIRSKLKGVKCDFGGKRVLVAEDNAINAELLMEFLTEGKLQCDCVGNGQAAIEKYEGMGAGYYDAILMDIHMPIMDGYEATRRIRNATQADAGSIPIIAVTENDSSENVIQSYEAGMNAFMPKPIHAEILYRTLNKYMR